MKKFSVWLSVLIGLTFLVPLFLLPAAVSAADPVYFRFIIPAGVKYSPGWFGVMTKCPKNVTVLLYNDKEGYGIAYTTDTYFPPEATHITSADASKALAEAKAEPGTYFASALIDRWLPSGTIKDVPIEGPAVPIEAKSFSLFNSGNLPLGISPKTQKGLYCPKCGTFVAWITNTDLITRTTYSVITDKTTKYTCPFGHSFWYCPTGSCLEPLDAAMTSGTITIR